MKLKEYPDQEMMMIDLANVLAGALNSALMTHDRASLAVPGGTTPGPVFDALSSVSLPWERVDIMLTDERWVPEDSPRSNTRLLRERLLVDRAAAARYVPLYKQAERPETVLDELAAEVEALRPLSVVLLGMGADMHTASIFPGADLLEEATAEDAPALLPMRAEGAGEPRITMTYPILKGAMARHFVITGDEKRAALEKARGLSPEEAPVAGLLPGSTVHWAP